MGISFKLFIIFVTYFVAAQQSATIHGPEFVSHLFEDLRVAFSLNNPYNLTYSTIPDADANLYLNNGQTVIVDTLENLPNSSLVIPFFGFPLVIVYNLPSSSSAVLKLSQQALVDIFLGQITRWNDNNLTVSNLNVTLPNQPITLVVGEMLDHFVEGLGVLAGVPLTQANMSNANTIQAGLNVCAMVKTTPYSIGFSWMGDALETGTPFAFLQNLQGHYASPVLGASYALSEFNAMQIIASDSDTVLPFNMPGTLSWPLMGVLYIILPEIVSTCDELIVIQHFLSLILFQTENMDLLAQVLGWQPARVLSTLDFKLGVVSDKFDYRDVLFSVDCGTKQVDTEYFVGTSQDLWTFVLKMLVPYSREIDLSIELSTTNSPIEFYMSAMLLGEKASEKVDMAFTWEPVALAYQPSLISIPCFMGSTVPLVNLANISSLILSLPVLASIFQGEITFWNDARIQLENPSVVLPFQPIYVFAATDAEVDSASMLFSQALTSVSPSFSWSKVNKTIVSEDDIVHILQFTPYSIGYAFGHLVSDAIVNVPQLIGEHNSKPISFTYDSLFACWNSMTDDACWPLAVPLVMVGVRATDETVCSQQKHSVDFVSWVMQRAKGLDDHLPPNTLTTSIGDFEFCDGRSLLRTIPEPQRLTSGAVTAVHVLCGLGMLWAFCQGCALAVARKSREIKSASVMFSFLAIVGIILMLMCPLLIVSNTTNIPKCSSAIWFLVIGFSLCYGSLFAKLFRLYTIFTSKKLVVPRLSNQKLFWIVVAFLFIDFVLLLIYNILTPPTSDHFSAFIRDDKDLVTGYRELTLNMCDFHDSVVLWFVIVEKCLVAIGGAAMAYFIRQVDRRFSATSALGWAFYNMFLTVIIAIVIMVFFQSNTDLQSTLFIPTFCGLWIVFGTLVALTLDSNVLLACRDFSSPLRRLINSKNSKNSKEMKDAKERKLGDSKEEGSRLSTIFVVNRDMFPSKYDTYEQQLLEKILAELTYQRAAVRKALLCSTSEKSTTNTVCIELPDLGGKPRQPSMQADTPRFNSKSKSGFSAEHSSRHPSEAPRPKLSENNDSSSRSAPPHADSGSQSPHVSKIAD